MNWCECDNWEHCNCQPRFMRKSPVNKSEAVGVRMPLALLARVNAYAESEGMSRSKAVRVLLAAALSQGG
jgi:hypothetical protein